MEMELRWNLRACELRLVMFFCALLYFCVIYNALESLKLLTASWLSSFTSSRHCLRRLSSAAASNSLHKIKIFFKIYCTSSSFKIGFKVEAKTLRVSFKYISGCLSIHSPPRRKLAQVPVALFNGLEYIFAFAFYHLDPHPPPLSYSLSLCIRLGHW